MFVRGMSGFPTECAPLRFSTIDDAPLYAGKGLDPSNVRPAGMSSEHLEAVARRERENAFHAKRQKDLGFGERAEYLDYDA